MAASDTQSVYVATSSAIDQEVKLRGVIKQFRLHSDGSILFQMIPLDAKQEHELR